MAKAYIDTIVTARPVANFGGDIMEPVFDWLYFTADWNVNNYEYVRQRHVFLFNDLVLLALICYFVLSRTLLKLDLFHGETSAAQANGVPTNKEDFVIYVYSFCATMFAACI